jgi:hypothetical protein
MFKVAFPGASEDDEKREMEWVSGARRALLLSI